MLEFNPNNNNIGKNSNVPETPGKKVAPKVDIKQESDSVSIKHKAPQKGIKTAFLGVVAAITTLASAFSPKTAAKSMKPTVTPQTSYSDSVTPGREETTAANAPSDTGTTVVVNDEPVLKEAEVNVKYGIPEDRPVYEEDTGNGSSAETTVVVNDEPVLKEAEVNVKYGIPEDKPVYEEDTGNGSSAETTVVVNDEPVLKEAEVNVKYGIPEDRPVPGKDTETGSSAEATVVVYDEEEQEAEVNVKYGIPEENPSAIDENTGEIVQFEGADVNVKYGIPDRPDDLPDEIGTKSPEHNVDPKIQDDVEKYGIPFGFDESATDVTDVKNGPPLPEKDISPQILNDVEKYGIPFGFDEPGTGGTDARDLLEDIGPSGADENIDPKSVQDDVEKYGIPFGFDEPGTGGIDAKDLIDEIGPSSADAVDNQE